MPAYKTTDGNRRTSLRCHVSFHELRDMQRRAVAFTDKAASGEFGRKLVKLVASVVACERSGADLAKRLDGPPAMRHSRTEVPRRWASLEANRRCPRLILDE